MDILKYLPKDISLCIMVLGVVHKFYILVNLPSKTPVHTCTQDISNYIPVKTFILQCSARTGLGNLELLMGKFQANKNITFMLPQSD